MKKGRRIISIILLLAMFASVIPMEYIVSAAPSAIYVLDTDGIDAGEEYLIVKGNDNKTEYYALQGADSTAPGATTKVQLDGDQVIAFDGIENYLWMMEDNGTGAYNVRHGDKYLNVPRDYGRQVYYQEEKLAFNIANSDLAKQENGEYYMYCYLVETDRYHSLSGHSPIKSDFAYSLNYGLMGFFEPIRFYKKIELQPSSYTISATTKLNDEKTNLSEFMDENTELHILLDDGTQDCQMLINTQPGVYTAEVTENGIYSVFLVDADGYRQDTNMDVVIEDADEEVELSYYSVTYDVDGGTLHGMDPIEYHLAGSTVLAKAEATRDNYQFMGWKDQNGNLVEGKGVVTQSLDKAITLTAQWKSINIDESLKTNYTIRYLLKGTYEELHVETHVAGAAINSKVDALQNALKLQGYTYCGATIHNVYYDKETSPALTLSEDETNNVLIIHYIPDPDMHLHKTAILEDDGTYTIEMEMFVHDNPVTTIVDLNAPLDIVLVLDQSGSIQKSGLSEARKQAVTSFVNLIAEHGRTNQADHRIAVVGYANDEDGPAAGEGSIAGSYDTTEKKTVKEPKTWINTGVFDAHGDFHAYPITGFEYTEYTGDVSTKGTYYTYSHGEYLLLTYHDLYRHMITESEAYTQLLAGETIYGNVNGTFTKLERNSNGMWVYTDENGDKKLYSLTTFFTAHNDVWTHRHGIEGREIHAYMIDGVYTPVDGHDTLFERTETTKANPDKSIYRDALIPVTMGANGSGYVDGSFEKIINSMGSKGQTYVSYGMEMANRVFEANPLTIEDEKEGRQRVVIVFTDGKIGDNSNFDEIDANKSIAQSYIASNTYGAEVFAIGLYAEKGVELESNQDYFMEGLSSNYPKAQSMEDVWAEAEYSFAKTGVKITEGGVYYIKDGGEYYMLTKSSDYQSGEYLTFWKYTNSAGQEKIAFKHNTFAIPTITAVEEDGIIKSKVEGVDIYKKTGNGYRDRANQSHYFKEQDPEKLKKFFETIVGQLTTKSFDEVMLTNDAFLRDVMGQGLVLTPGTKITVSWEAGVFLPDEKRVNWSGVPVELATLTIGDKSSSKITSEATFNVDGKKIPYITVYNLDAENATDPNGAYYRPHTVDIVGYDYSNPEWYLNAASPNGRRLIVTITRVEARDDVAWNKPQTANQKESGFWAIAENGEQYLLEAFVQPTTVFADRAYVVDYGKEFELSGWYFDSEGDKQAQVNHVDFEIENGMNWFENGKPTIQNSNLGNTKYGNVRIEDGKMYYQPTTMQWGGYDQFYVFGKTWRNTVVTQNANENGNLWNRVTVIPASNIYYEDSFVTGQSNGTNDISGFVFTGAWEIVNGENAGKNTETPEQVEDSKLGGGVHGWTDAWLDDDGFSDNSAHVASPDPSKKESAIAQFTFTGTGVDVYTRTNKKSGIVFATLKSVSGTSTLVSKSLIVDNLAQSGDYYQIPTVSFMDLEYGTYEVTLIATAASAVATGSMRYEYYLDGIRVYNPLGVVTQDSNSVVKDAYGKELNAMYTEIRDIVIANDDFIPDLNNDGVSGAVFIDWIQKGQENGDDVAGVGTGTYEVSTTFKTYGPKNEIYLEKGQAVVIKVDSKNTYYVGMKSIDAGKAAKVNICGLEMKEPQTITVSHTVDMYYEVVPIDGYIVIQNASENGALLALTKLKTTNLTEKITSNGVLPVVAKYAVWAMERFDLALEEAKNKPAETPTPEVSVDPFALYQQQTNQLFEEVRSWLEETE